MNPSGEKLFTKVRVSDHEFTDAVDVAHRTRLINIEIVSRGREQTGNVRLAMVHSEGDVGHAFGRTPLGDCGIGGEQFRCPASISALDRFNDVHVANGTAGCRLAVTSALLEYRQKGADEPMEQEQREQLRNEYKLRPLNGSEEGQGIATLPNNVYGFSYAPTTETPLFARKSYHSFEVQKLSDGIAYVVAFVTPTDAERLGNETWRSRSRSTPTHMKKQTRWSASRSIGC